MKTPLPLVLAVVLWPGPAMAGADEQYPRYELLMEPAELAEPQVSAQLAVLDVRAPEAYDQGHLPGARRVDHEAWKEAFGDGQDAKGWSERIGGLGIGSGTKVVLYDANGMKDAARIWWILRYWGVEDVRLLNGGWKGWQSAGLRTTGETPAPASPVEFQATPRSRRLATKRQILDLLGGNKLQIVDARSETEFCGIAKGSNKKGGAIPGAKHLEWSDLIDPQTQRLKSPGELRGLFDAAGIDLDRPTASYCQSGGRASVMAFGLELMGAKDVRNYYQSWQEWGNSEDTPVMLVPEKAAETHEPATRHLVSRIDVKDFGAETLRIGDLNGDGGPDLLFVQSVYGTREITCLTATTLFGEVLWQSGAPSAENGRIYSDLPVQVYDWDRDGRNEVLYVRQARYAEPPYAGGVRERASRYEGDATMLILDGTTGDQKSTLTLPAPADDCFLFADLTGRGRREDLVVKDRYWNMWGVTHEGRVLWQWTGSTGHFPAVGDVDGDGKDEVFVGFALIDDDGKVLFETDPKGAHQDACYLVRPADGKLRLLFGNGGIHCLAADGTALWQHPLGEAQHVVAGRFRTDSEMQFAVVDRTPVPTHRRDHDAWAILYLYDLDGKEIWRRQQEKGAWCIATVTVNWFGHDAPHGVFVYGQGEGRPAVVYDGEGNVVDTFPMAYAPDVAPADRPAEFYGLAADVWGDGRDEVLLFNARGACIYANARPLAIPTLYNETLYPGM